MKHFLLTAILAVSVGPGTLRADPTPNGTPVPGQQNVQQGRVNKGPRRVGSPRPQQQSPPPNVHSGASHRSGTPANQNQSATNSGTATVHNQNHRNNGNKDRERARASYAEALRRYRHERHDRNWWHLHFPVIVFVNRAYYYWDAGYWYPAWGYDPVYDYYDYDGPIYTYGNLLPDQVIYNVQRALQELGYYAGNLTGSLGPATRQALSNYQQDAGLDVTGAIDAETVEALGLVGGD